MYRLPVIPAPLAGVLLVLAFLAAGPLQAASIAGLFTKAPGRKKMVSKAESKAPFASGPLRVSPRNPRYFEDGRGRIVYLTGSHTWANLADIGPTDPPAPFDYEGYLDLLQRHNHNLIRLWASTHFLAEEGGVRQYSAPLPWERTGPGRALDGKPKFDLTRLNQKYFDRLRSRVIAAGRRNIYVSIMLFESWYRVPPRPWDNDGQPFHKDNNINGINGDPTSKGVGYTYLSLDDPAITAIQEAYVRKVIDTVNDLDNVLYEISNESRAHSVAWQYHMIKFVHDYERTKPKRHPVGMTDPCESGIETNPDLVKSDAEWISPHDSASQDYLTNPPAADGSKVIISDTDHLEGRWQKGTVPRWIWKSLCRGINTWYMDGEAPTGVSPERESVRKALGYTRLYAERMNLAKVVPCNGLASSEYCLSDKKTQFLVFLPDGPKVQVNLTGVRGFFNVEWLNPNTGEIIPSGHLRGGGRVDLTCPFTGPAVVYVWRK